MRKSISDEEFVRLWRCNPHRSTRDIAAELEITPRGVNKRASGLGLPPRNVHPTRASLIRADLLEAAGLEAVLGAPPAWTEDPRIAPVSKEFTDRLLAAKNSDDVARLWPLGIKLAMMLAVYHPGQAPTFRDLANLVKHALVCRRIEADMPLRADPGRLRQEAAQQMMQEVASVLTDEEQGRLGRMLQVASDRLAARRKEGATSGPAAQVVTAIQSPANPVASSVGAPW